MSHLLHEFLLAAARTAPHRPAVVEFLGDDRTRVVSYRELDDLVGRYAETLRGLDLEVGERVVLDSDTSASAIAALLACATLGLTFVPVSPETPDQRVRTIVAATEPALYLSAGEGARPGVEGGFGVARFGPDGCEILRRPTAHAGLPARPSSGPRREVAATDIAYMIFTSGTTGRPKGVMMSHRAVTSFYRGMLTQRIVGPHDRVATTSPLQFDFSLLDIGLALASGAAVVPVPRARLRWPRRFLRVLRDTGASQVNGVPSIWRQVLRFEPDRLAELRSIRGVLFCGEDFPLPELRALRRALPEARLVNCYGATESMAASFTDVPDPLPPELTRLSIGFAHPGAEMLLVGEDGRPIEEPDVLGEIHLRSPALFSGYWRDRATTDATLVPDPVDPGSGRRVLRTGDLAYRGEGGELYFRGRTDSQVQIRGNRVELGEVERRLLEHPAVTAATALAPRGPDGETELAAFVVVAPGAGERETEAELTDFLAAALPAYMVPGELRALPALPVTANGKVDRAALAQLTEAAPA
ncbi:AMP-binding protein [Streptomyces triticirhizae]|uniref:AMP-dependent synthetase n=1 Tax=Streptomyces triticirhizae TaxID=2483353 RepID=A0A3M2LT99_9ACTN|nr:AMP-binding protein [Streptomyces triticirhizae]RMI40627.1 AMP-dependent synthetase [Streptomyces triticirhizae]